MCRQYLAKYTVSALVVGTLDPSDYPDYERSWDTHGIHHLEEEYPFEANSDSEALRIAIGHIADITAKFHPDSKPHITLDKLLNRKN